MNELVCESLAMRELRAALLDVAGAPTTVLISGESGTGKGFAARWLHAVSPRAAAPLTVLGAVDVSGPAVERAQHALAHGGTVVVDDAGTLPHDAQERLLWLLEQPRTSRVVALASSDLGELVARGLLRAELFYRLDVFPVRVPPLRERREDLPTLAEQLLRAHAEALGRSPPRLDPAATAALLAHGFPGNVRELSNVLERALLRTRAPTLEADALGLAPAGSGPGLFPAHLPLRIEQLERAAIAEALRRSGGNRTHAARLLGLGLRTLRQKLNGPTPPGAAPPKLVALPDVHAHLQEAS